MTRIPRGRLLIGLVAGGVVVVVAVVVVLAVVLTGLFRAGSEGPADVADISSEPRETWTFDWVGDADAEFIEDTPLVAPVGDDKALVWTAFDAFAYSESQGDSSAWYEGYDEQYDDGYAAGLQWAEDYDAYWDSTSLSLPLPVQEDYYPEGAYGDYEDWLGFDDGFYDAARDKGENFSKKAKPVAPDYSPTMTMLDTRDGSTDWTIDLAESIDGVDFSTTFYAIDVPGSDAVVVSSSTPDRNTDAFAVVALSRADGSVISRLVSDHQVGIQAMNEDVVVTLTDADGTNSTTIARYAVTGLGDEPVWQVDGPKSATGATVSALGTRFIQALGEDEGVVLLAASGREAEFGEDVSSEVSYLYAGDRLVRSERTDDATVIQGWTENGEPAWGEPVAADNARVIDGRIFIAESDGDFYTRLAAIDPASGKHEWQKPFATDFDSVYGVRNGNVLVISGTTLHMLDAATGQQRFTQKLGDLSAFYEGANAYYVYTGDHLAAYGYGQEGALWSLTIGDDKGVIAIGHTLGLIDFTEGTLRGLA